MGTKQQASWWTNAARQLKAALGSLKPTALQEGWKGWQAGCACTCSLLASFQTHLDLGKEHCEALSCADLSSPSGVEACIAAAEALSACMNIQIQSGRARKRFMSAKSRDISLSLSALLFHLVRSGRETGLIPTGTQSVLLLAELVHPCYTSRSAGIYRWAQALVGPVNIKFKAISMVSFSMVLLNTLV